MDFTCTELQDAIRQAIGREFPGEDDAALVTDDEVRRRLDGLGLIGLEVPERHGGRGMGIANGIVLVEALGARAGRNAYSGLATLSDFRMITDEGALDSLLREACVERRRVILAQLDARGRVLSRDRIQEADIVVALRGDSMSDNSEIRVMIAGELLEQPLDWRTTSPITFSPDSFNHVAMLSMANDNAGWPWLLTRTRIRHASYLLGLTLYAVELGVKRLGTRRQFGTELSAFQALTLPLAGAFAHTEALRLVIHEAASRAETGRTAVSYGKQVLAYASELVTSCVAKALHVHGAHGMTERARIAHLYCHTLRESSRLRAYGP